MPYLPRVAYEPALLATVYEPLEPGEMRLLQLYGHDEQGVLLCTLSHVSLDRSIAGEDDEGTYTAISYTWNIHDRIWYGVYSTEPKPVFIDGKLVLISDKVANILSLMCQVQVIQ